MIENLQVKYIKPDFHFIGFFRDPHAPVLYGHLLLKGIVTFRSGRKQIVYYQSPVMIPTVDGMAADDIIQIVERGLGEADKEMRSFVSWGERGYLKNWLNGRRLRPVASVEWHHWQDRIEDVQ